MGCSLLSAMQAPCTLFAPTSGNFAEDARVRKESLLVQGSKRYRQTMSRRDNYYDYIRALAALLVLFAHKGQMPGGSIGVSIFFCLSGFLITQILIGLPSLTISNVAKFI